MHEFLRQSTASQARQIGPFIDDTDFKTPKTALTIDNADVKLSKNGAVSVNKNGPGTATARQNGNYSVTFDATDTNTVGELAGSVKVATALVVVFKFTVLKAEIYDAIFGSAANGFDATGKVTLAGVTHTGAVIPTVSVLTGHTNQSGDSFARLGAPAGASIADDIATKPTTAQVNSEVVDVLKIDTIADLAAGAPPNTPTFEQAVMYLYSALVNRGVADKTDNEKHFYNSAGTKIWEKDITKTANTYDEAKGSTPD